MSKHKENLRTLKQFVESVHQMPTEFALEDEEDKMQAHALVELYFGHRLRSPLGDVSINVINALATEALGVFYACADRITQELEQDKKSARKKSVAEFATQTLLDEIAGGQQTDLLRSEVEDLSVMRFSESAEHMMPMLRKTAEIIASANTTEEVTQEEADDATSRETFEKAPVEDNLTAIDREEPSPVVQTKFITDGESEAMSNVETISLEELRRFHTLLDNYVKTLLKVQSTENFEQNDTVLNCIKGVFSGRLIIAPEDMNDKTLKLLFTDALIILRTVHDVIHDVLHRNAGVIAGLRTQVLNAVLQCVTKESIMVTLPNNCVAPITTSSMCGESVDLADSIISFIERMGEEQKVEARCQILIDSMVPTPVQETSSNNEVAPVASMPLAVNLYALAQNNDPTHGKKYNLDLERLMLDAIARYYKERTIYEPVDFKLLTACVASIVIDTQMRVVQNNNTHSIYRKKMTKKLIERPEDLTREIVEHFKINYVYHPSFRSVYVIQETRTDNLETTLLPTWYQTYGEASSTIQELILNRTDKAIVFNILSVKINA